MSYTVGDLVAEFLAAADVTTVFGIVSVHNIPILDAIGRRNAIRRQTPARLWSCSGTSLRCGRPVLPAYVRAALP